ncbi:MAG: 23S rRNA (uracil-5-)-methyltransferase RumA, partial [Wujia sp.]
MRKGDIYEGIITEYDFPNKGSLMIEDRKVTIKGALKGQKVRFMITKKKSGLAEGRVLEVLERSVCEDEVPSCKYFGLCGGCAYSTMSYKEQLKLKEGMVKKLLDKAIPEDYLWEGIVPSPVVEGYRNKMEFTFGDEYKGGPLALGLHRKGNFYDILNVSGCEIIGSAWS